MLATKTLKFEVITPLYLGGPDPRAEGGNDCQIRLRPILAMWRYWFRALLGGIVGTEAGALRTIQEKENELFGGVFGEEGSAAAKFRAWVEADKINSSQYPRQPISYLGFGTGKEVKTGVPARYAINPDTKPFKVHLVLTDDVWAILKHSIYVWTICGGLGARQRRGLGSIRWLNPDPDQRFAMAKDSIHAAQNSLSALYRIEAPPQLHSGQEPAFDVIRDGYFDYKLCAATYTSWIEALQAIKNQLRVEPDGHPTKPLGANGTGWRQRDVRGNFQAPKPIRGAPPGHYYIESRDKAEAEKVLRQNPATIQIRNVSFGLPIAFGKWPLTVELKRGSEKLRRPSPISFRVLKTGDYYQVAVLFFKSVFKPDGSDVFANRVLVSLPDVWQDLSKFFEQLT